MLMTWTDSMSVGVKEFDDDHKRLLQLMNEMHDVLEKVDEKGRIPAEEIEATLEQLQKYFRGHCYNEEHAMARTGYPGLEEHAEEHHKFMTRVREISFLARGSNSAEHGKELLQFIFHWLTNHIIVTDRKYTSYLNSKGIF